MTMLRSVSVSLFLGAFLALYLALLVVFNPVVPGVPTLADARMAYSCAFLLLGVFCCVSAGITWSFASTVRAWTAVISVLSVWFVLLLSVCLRLLATDRLPLYRR